MLPKCIRFTTLLIFDFILSSSLPSLLPTALAYKWPSPRYDALEGFLYEGTRSDGSSMASLVHPCKLRTRNKSSIAAEWLRFAYHDVATHDIEAGTGGLDGSIAYELDRMENIGSGMNETLRDIETFPHKYLTRADVIAIATIFAVSTCGGPIIPFRGGRTDAQVSGPFGVPEPHQDLSTHTKIFQKQGFSREDMIKLVACGHTMGGVRSFDFPDIAPPAEDLSLPNIELFDGTHEFDDIIVRGYLDGSTKNPLAAHENATFASDRRIFSSDGNLTMQNLVSSSSSFTDSCRDVLERMINVVPSNVQLSEEITMLPVKVTNVGLTIDGDVLVFKATLRLTKQLNVAVNKGRVVTMYWCDRYGGDVDCAQTTKFAFPAVRTQDDVNISPVAVRMETAFVYYQFVVPVDTELSISKFWFTIDEKNGSPVQVHDNDGGGYSVEQDSILFVPELSAFTFSEDQTVYTLIAGVRGHLLPSRVYMSGFDNAIRGHPDPFNITVDMNVNTDFPPVAGYVLYSGQIQDRGSQLTVDFNCDANGRSYTDDFRPTFSLGRAASSPPTNVSSVASHELQHNATSGAAPAIFSSLWTQLLALTIWIFMYTS